VVVPCIPNTLRRFFGVFFSNLVRIFYREFQDTRDLRKGGRRERGEERERERRYNSISLKFFQIYTTGQRVLTNVGT